MPLPIEDYALIGDCHTAGLVGKDGSIDWLCFPRFDSEACFAALLGTPDHGRWQIIPDEPIRQVVRSYRGDSLVLDTTFYTDSGVVTLTDCMPIRSGQPDLVRLVRGVQGQVPMRMELIVRFDYGSVTPWMRRDPQGLTAIGGPDMIHLRTPAPLFAEGWTTQSRFTLSEGQQMPFVLNWHPSHLPIPETIEANEAVEATAAWWHEWAGKCTYEGPWREAVMRSLITLKALTYQPTGGIVAAATTSLPEHLGGGRNWDYRYCWLRDATFTLTALLQCGYTEEARDWREWLLRAVAGRGDELHIMYGLAGERRLNEMTLPWLPGYENSRPVRVGNAAYDQFQLDVFGEVLDCLHVGRRYGLDGDRDEWRIEREMLARLEVLWREPDEGIWEVRGPRQHFTHSKLMAWVAFDRAVKDAERLGLPGAVERWKRYRDELHAEICERGFSRRRNSFVQAYDSEELDAAVLMMAELGFLPPQDPRIVGTVEAIARELTRDGFVDRYHTATGVDGLPPGEGSFLLCTFWLADNYALLGRHGEARRIFDNLLSIRNDVGLLAEQYEPRLKRQLGNFPQAFSHLGLINTARNLTRTQSDKPCHIRYQE